MQINSYILKVSGRAELPHDIEVGHNYHVSLEGSIPKVEMHDNEDGTWNQIYTFNPITVELLDKKGKTLKLKDTRSASQLLRGRLWKKWQDANTDLPFDEWYNRIMLELIKNVDELVSMYGKE